MAPRRPGPFGRAGVAVELGVASMLAREPTHGSIDAACWGQALFARPQTPLASPTRATYAIRHQPPGARLIGMERPSYLSHDLGSTEARWERISK